LCEQGCYFPAAFPNGIGGSSADAGFNVAYGQLEVTDVGVIELRGNTRAYMVRDHKRSQSEYQHLNLLGSITTRPSNLWTSQLLTRGR
jgi:hypothetical protein